MGKKNLEKSNFMNDKKDYFLLVAMFKSCRYNKINFKFCFCFNKISIKKYDVYLITHVENGINILNL